MNFEKLFDVITKCYINLNVKFEVWRDDFEFVFFVQSQNKR